MQHSIVVIRLGTPKIDAKVKQQATINHRSLKEHLFICTHADTDTNKHHSIYLYRVVSSHCNVTSMRRSNSQLAITYKLPANEQSEQSIRNEKFVVRKRKNTFQLKVLCVKLVWPTLATHNRSAHTRTFNSRVIFAFASREMDVAHNSLKFVLTQNEMDNCIYSTASCQLCTSTCAPTSTMRQPNCEIKSFDYQKKNRNTEPNRTEQQEIEVDANNRNIRWK